MGEDQGMQHVLLITTDVRDTQHTELLIWVLEGVPVDGCRL